MLRQRTIRKPVHAIGIGVHSGDKVRMTLRPAGENTGITFIRTDVKGSAPIRATAENVSDTTLSTSLGAADVQVATVEHLMSALWGLGIDNLIVELSCEEVPIMDGSAAPFVYLIMIESPSTLVLTSFLRKNSLKLKTGETKNKGTS